MQMKNPFDILVDELVEKIFSNLNFKSRIRASRVCKRWNWLVDESFETYKGLKVDDMRMELIDLKRLNRLPLYKAKLCEYIPSRIAWPLHDFILSRLSRTLTNVSLCWWSLDHIVNSWVPPSDDDSCPFPRTTRLRIDFGPEDFDQEIEMYSNNEWK